MTKKELLREDFLKNCKRFSNDNISIVVGKVLLMKEKIKRKKFFVVANILEGLPGHYYRDNIETFQSFSEAWKSFESRADFRKRIL